jgi:hypothetical protein
MWPIYRHNVTVNTNVKRQYLKHCNITRHHVLDQCKQFWTLPEIPQPDDARYECTLCSYLGIAYECLCICCPLRSGRPIWVMKKYNVKQSWTLLPPYKDAPQKVNDAIHAIKPLEDKIPHIRFLTCANIKLRCRDGDICAPIFVHSLVSPNVCKQGQSSLSSNYIWCHTMSFIFYHILYTDYT